MIYLAADHGGFNIKEDLIKFFEDKKIKFEDLGAYLLTPDDDYPEYALKMAEKIQNDHDGKGIIICRNGVGVSMLANKFKGVRAGISHSVNHVYSSRNDDDINVLALPSDYVSSVEALNIVRMFLETPFSGASRHKRRLDIVADYGQERADASDLPEQ